ATVASNAEAFVEWTSAHLLDPVNLYTAYPGVTAKEIKTMASAADVSDSSEQRPFLVILPIKSSLAFIEVKLLLLARGSGTTKDLDKVGTPHFAQFVPLEDNQIGFFTVYDGTFDTYIADFTKNIAQESSKKKAAGVFGRLFEHSRSAKTATLDLDDIQGFILRGYRMPMVRHFLLTVGVPAEARKLLGRFVSGDESDAPQITTAEEWQVGFAAGPRDDAAEVSRHKPDYCLNVGITWQGMIALEIKDRVPTLSFN